MSVSHELSIKDLRFLPNFPADRLDSTVSWVSVETQYSWVRDRGQPLNHSTGRNQNIIFVCGSSCVQSSCTCSGHLCLQWASVPAVGVCACGGHLYLRWGSVHSVGVCACSGHLCMQWASVPSVGCITEEEP